MDSMDEGHSGDEVDLFRDNSQVNHSSSRRADEEASRQVLMGLASDSFDVLDHVRPGNHPRQNAPSSHAPALNSNESEVGEDGNLFSDSEDVQGVEDAQGDGDPFAKYIFNFPQYTEWLHEYEEIKEQRDEPGMSKRFEDLQKKFRQFLFQLRDVHLTDKDPFLGPRTIHQRAAFFLGLRMDICTTIDFEKLHERNAFARNTFTNIHTMSMILLIIQPLNGNLRRPEEIECQEILETLNCILENYINQVLFAWQFLNIVKKQPIDGTGVPRSFENMLCQKMTEPKQQYIHFIETCIVRNDLKIDFSGNVYAPRMTKVGKRYVSTRYYRQLQYNNGKPIKLEDLVNLLSKTPGKALPSIKDYMQVVEGVNVPTNKFALHWNHLHASTLHADITSSGRGKGQALVNEINNYLSTNMTERMDLLPKGQIVYAFKNMVMQVTPIVKCFPHREMPKYMNSFQFFEQDLRPEVAELVNEYHDLQQSFTDHLISRDVFLQQSLDVTRRLRVLNNHLESCMTYQNWEEGTINAFYAFVLPQMICRRHWNHSNEKIMRDDFTAQPSGLMVVLVGITGSGKTVLAELVNFAIPKDHRMNMSVGGGQKDFQLTQLAQKPHTLFIELSDARESLKTLSKELILQIMGGGDFTIDVKFGLPLELNERCFGMLAATNDQSVEFCQDEYSDGRDINASERRTILFLLNETHMQKDDSSNDINERLRSQADSYIAISFILFNLMRQLHTASSIYNMVCGKYKAFTPVFGTQLAEFRQNINNVGDTYRKLFLMEGMFVSRADRLTRNEDNVLCIPMQVLLDSINARLQKIKKPPIFSGTVKTYLDRIFNDPKAPCPTIYIEKHLDFLWRGVHYKDDEIVFGITLSYSATKRPFLTDVQLADIEHVDPAEHALVVENIRMHMEQLVEYDDPLGLFIKMHVMKFWKYIPDDEDAELTLSGDSFYGAHYKTFMIEFQKWCDKTCFANVEGKVGNLLTARNIQLVETKFREAGWTDITITKKTINYEGVPGSIFIISNIVAFTQESAAPAVAGNATPAYAGNATPAIHGGDMGAPAVRGRRGPSKIARGATKGGSATPAYAGHSTPAIHEGGVSSALTNRGRQDEPKTPKSAKRKVTESLSDDPTEADTAPLSAQRQTPLKRGRKEGAKNTSGGRPSIQQLQALSFKLPMGPARTATHVAPPVRTTKAPAVAGNNVPSSSSSQPEQEHSSQHSNAASSTKVVKPRKKLTLDDDHPPVKKRALEKDGVTDDVSSQMSMDCA